MSERPWYETKGDCEREWIIARRFCQKWKWPEGLQLVKREVTDGYEIDFDALTAEGKVRLRLETKFRGYKFGKYPTLFIGQRKAEYARSLWRADSIPIFFAAAFKCGRFAYADLCYPAIREVKFGGRQDRNDPLDEEMMLHIPLDQLKEF